MISYGIVAALVGGLVLLTVGAEILVGGAVALARRLRMSPLLIGITIVGFGTSLPELVVSVKAALRGSPDIAIGNVVGSNTANILLIMGLAAVIAPIFARLTDFRRDLAVMVGASFVLAILGYVGGIPRLAGMAMVAILLVYLVIAARSGKTEPDENGPRATGWRQSLPVSLLLCIAGLAALFVGAGLLVDAAIDFAVLMGISEAVIGLTIVAVGTSLPELATSVAAAYRRQPEVSLGNIVGSNIFNILGILGVTAILTPVPISTGIARADIPVMVVTAFILVGLIGWRQGIGRIGGLVLLGLYTAYVAWLIAGG